MTAADTADAALAESLRLFRELGWEDATNDDVLTLPLGTALQQKTAKAGLLTGEWSSLGQTGDSSWGWINHVGVDTDRLGAFAIRLGVPVKRALEVFPTGLTVAAQGEFLASCGEQFVTQFLNQRRARMRFAGAIAYAISRAPDIAVPNDIGYLESWATRADSTIRVADGETTGFPENLLPYDTVAARFADHLRAALTSGVTTSGNWIGVIGRGVAHGLIERDEVRDLVLHAMESAQRPIDRKEFATVLMDDLTTTDAYVLDHVGVVLSALSFGDDALINRFAPTLLAAGDDDLTLQVMLIGLSAKSAKAKAGVLEAALANPAPSAETAAMIGESVAELRTAKDKKVSKLAERLLDEWGLDAEAPVVAAPIGVRGLWQPTPPLAPVPRFDAGPPTVENLTALTSTLLAGPGESLDLPVERFLATANAVARDDIEAVRRALRSVPQRWSPGLHPVHGWRTGGTIIGSDELDASSSRRQYDTAPRACAAAVFQRLGEIPTLLSTPTWDDYRIDPGDLADRLDRYAAEGIAVLEADVQLALPRVDRSLLNDRVRERLESSAVPIVLQEGSTLPVTTGQVLTRWFATPFEHPGEDSDGFVNPIPPHPALVDFPDRRGTARTVPLTEYPTWADGEPGWRQPEPALLRGIPNGEIPASALLAFGDEGGLGLDAAITAWNNGVLLPGVARARQLSWQGGISAIASRVRAWAELADAGMLSIVWPLAAEVIDVSATGARIPPGVAEAIEFLEHMLPEAEAAIAAGLATPDALALPGVRTIAARTGSSNAVVAARRLAARLPDIAPTAEVEREDLTDEQFASVWPAVPDPEVIEDGAVLSFSRTPGKRGSAFVVTLTLADGSVHEFTSGWTYGLVNEGIASLGQSWLGYDPETRALVNLTERERSRDALLSRSLVVLLFATQLQPTPETYYFADAAAKILGPTRVADAVDVMLASEDFDPSMLVRRLSHYPAMLPSLYPVLTHAIRHASTLEGTPPRWLVRIVDVATEFAPALRAAGSHGVMFPEDAQWPGLSHIAATTTSAAVKRKSAALLDLLDLPR
ncbi:hypothetical protein [Microbacterium sp. ZW T5_56]|uniref:hypothetical protein n=1 Tax=Microbacterium sp. ZW T5_56 TaxID=3378081 RepID=UPI00385222B1